MTTDNAQDIIEHIVNIDTTAENITSINTVVTIGHAGGGTRIRSKCQKSC